MSSKDTTNKFSINLLIQLAFRYILEGVIIAMAALYIPTIYKSSLRKPTMNEIFSIGLTAALTMLLLDYFSEMTAAGARFGIGFELGKALFGMK
jgi:hypothetical protein